MFDFSHCVKQTNDVSLCTYCLDESLALRAEHMVPQVDVCEQPGNFETVFERKYSSFQLFCRGVAALRHALRNRVEIEGTPNAVDMSKEGVLVRKRNCSASLNAEDAKRQAEIYLLRTRGAELANLITESECSKLVRRVEGEI